MKPRETAKERRRRELLAAREQRQKEAAQRIAAVITEFNGDAEAMARAILEYRRASMQIADAVEWMRVGAPFVSLGPGPLWQPRPVPPDGSTVLEKGGADGPCLAN
jgi:hypothetical protein